MSEGTQESEGRSGVSIALGVVGVLLLITVGGYVYATRGMSSRSKSSEVKGNLRAVLRAHVTELEDSKSTSTLANKIGFEPERGNRYGYFLADTGPVQARRGTSLVSDAPRAIILVDQLRYPEATAYETFGDTHCPITPCGDGDRALTKPGVLAPDNAHPDWLFLVAAAGNVDRDEALDCWSVCSHARRSKGVVVPAGEVFQEVAD